MKITIKKITMAVCLLCLWNSSPAYSSDTLTGSEERNILTEIGNICFDVWCEGGYSFNFHTFECSFDKEECLFQYEYTGWRGVEDSFEAECLISAGSADDLVANENTFEISDYLYNQVSNCIDESSGEVYDHYRKLHEEANL